MPRQERGQVGFRAATIGLALALSLMAASGAWRYFADAAPGDPTMTVDADAGTAGIQADRTLLAVGSFNLAVVASGPFTTQEGYTWELQWTDATLDFVSATENSGGHLATLCAPAQPVDGEPVGKEWVGLGAGCLRFGGTLNDTGADGSEVLVTVTLSCNVADGSVSELHLVTIGEDSTFGSTFLAPGGNLTSTNYVDAQVQCGAAAPNTPTPTATNTAQPTSTNTPQPTSTNTPGPTPTDTPIPTSTFTPQPTSTHTPAPTATNTPVPTSTFTPGPTSTHTPVPTPTNTPQPTSTNTPGPTPTDTPIPTSTHTPQPTSTHTPVPTATNTAIPTSTSTPGATNTPRATSTTQRGSTRTPSPTNTLPPATATTRPSTATPVGGAPGSRVTTPPAGLVLPRTGSGSGDDGTNYVLAGLVLVLAGLGMVGAVRYNQHRRS